MYVYKYIEYKDENRMLMDYVMSVVNTYIHVYEKWLK